MHWLPKDLATLPRQAPPQVTNRGSATKKVPRRLRLTVSSSRGFFGSSCQNPRVQPLFLQETLLQYDVRALGDLWGSVLAVLPKQHGAVQQMSISVVPAGRRPDYSGGGNVLSVAEVTGPAPASPLPEHQKPSCLPGPT